MIDRESTFADPEIVSMLQTRFVPVAIDQKYQRRQKDEEGDFYRKIASQGPRNDFERGTTQGFYIATASGELLLYNNNRNPPKVRRLMKEQLEVLAERGAPRPVPGITETRPDQRFHVVPPRDGAVVRVRGKVLDGYAAPKNESQEIMQSALSRDNLWLSPEEQEQIAAGIVPDVVQQRIARFHLVDGTRGEPLMWKTDEVRHVAMTIDHGVLRGTVHLESADGQRGYQAELLGHLQANNQRLTRFDVVARGDHWGHGPYTRNPPQGKFPLAIAFSLADQSDIADQVPPQASMGWIDGYMKADQ